VAPLKTFEEVFDRLNKYQKEAVTNENQVALVNANVGSGKTTVLISKIFYQHFNKGIDFKDMVVLTFTNKAAVEIKKRITDAQVDISDEDMPYFGTFHSVALNMLRNILPVANLGYTNTFSVMDPDELIEMAMELIAENGFKIKYKNKLKKRFEELKAGKTSYAGMKYEDDIQSLWEATCKEKINQNKMDFNDLIINAKKLLDTVAFSPKWIIIDEFQDCDESQLEFIKALKGREAKIFAVGDPNQIIYTWRGSVNNIFNKFKSEYDAQELTLPVNYRSSTTILEAARCFLSKDTLLTGTREAGNPINLVKHYDPFNEANYLMDKIEELHNNGVCYKEIAVFYRTQKQSKLIEEVFQRGNIPFQVSVRKTLTDIPVLRWLVNLLKTSVNVDDKSNLISVLKDKNFGEGLSKAKIKKIVLDKTDVNSSLYTKVRGFESWSLNQKSTLSIYDYFELDSYLSPTSVTFLENREYVLNFLDKIIQYINYKSLSLSVGIKEFINSSALYGTDILKEDINLSKDCVKLMTLHACKGLEFKYVFIIGVNYGLIPLKSSFKEEEEEEKRLFFVGLTRAIDNLEISYYTHPGNPWVLPGQSSYIEMLPKHLIKSSENNESSTNLRDLRREIKNNMESSMKNQVIKEEIKKKVRHERYGIGTVESEDDNTIRVTFEGYGIKEFAKAFNPLQFL
jgi:DNA helicase II / ATP-dependent DNA helicase PcrA